MSPKFKSLIFLTIPILFAVSLSYFLQYKVLSNQEAFTNWLDQFGPFVILVYILFQALTIIIAPLGGLFLMVTMIALYGPEKAILLAYLICVPSYQINFLLARRYGRPLVTKIIGEDSLKKIDHYAVDAGIATLVITRILQASNFDYISYAWGLTKVSVKSFTIVNIFAGILGSLVSYFIFTRFDNLVFGIILFYGCTVLLAGFTIYITHKIKKHKAV